MKLFYCLAIVLSGLVYAGSSVPAHATSTLECIGVDDSSVIARLTLGSLPVLGVVGAVIETPLEDFSINATGDQTPIAVGQGFGDAEGIEVDFTDPNIEQIIVSFRSVRAEGDKQLVQVATLSVRQTEVYALNCAEP
ncbi:MAG: hypothetical protein AAGH60_03395 [Pseudomonadota bacterium]